MMRKNLKVFERWKLPKEALKRGDKEYTKLARVSPSFAAMSSAVFVTESIIRKNVCKAVDIRHFVQFHAEWVLIAIYLQEWSVPGKKNQLKSLLALIGVLKRLMSQFANTNEHGRIVPDLQLVKECADLEGTLFKLLPPSLCGKTLHKTLRHVADQDIPNWGPSKGMMDFDSFLGFLARYLTRQSKPVPNIISR